MRVGPHQGLDPGGDVGPLRVQGDELAGQVGQHRAGGLGAGDGDGLPAQGRYDLAGPGGVAPGAVLLELGVDAGPAGLPQRGGGGPCGDDLQDGVVPRPRSQDGLQGGVDPGAHGPRIRPSVWLTCLARSRSKPVSMLSAAASSSEVLMALRVWGMVRAAPAITAASFASVLALPGVRSAMRRIDSPGR